MTIIAKLTGGSASDGFTISEDPNNAVRLVVDENRLSIRDTNNTSDQGLICAEIISSSTIVGTAFLGNANTATALQTPRNISGIPFDGSSDIVLTTTEIGEGDKLYFTNTRARSAIPFSSQTQSGTIKTVGSSSDPVTYLASEIDDLLTTKADVAT
jgi:hypothetical protein